MLSGSRCRSSRFIGYHRQHWALTCPSSSSSCPGWNQAPGAENNIPAGNLQVSIQFGEIPLNHHLNVGVRFIPLQISTKVPQRVIYFLTFSLCFTLSFNSAPQMEAAAMRGTGVGRSIQMKTPRLEQFSHNLPSLLGIIIPLAQLDSLRHMKCF